jgi:hypothetical protein
MKLGLIPMPDLKPKRAGCALNLVQLQQDSRVVYVHDNCHAAQTGNDLAQKLKSLAGNINLLQLKLGNIPAWSRQTGDEAVADRVHCGGEDLRCGGFTRPQIRISFQSARLESFTLQAIGITVGRQFGLRRAPPSGARNPKSGPGSSGIPAFARLARCATQPR